MISASLYVIGCTWRNRIRVRLKRLREPRYLIGAFVGAAYLYFSVFARLRSNTRLVASRGRASRAGRPNPLPSFIEHGSGFIGAFLFIAAVLAWILPLSSAMLDFTGAEVQFLFPAPVSRRALLVHRLMRSQIGLLFGAVISSFVVPSATGLSRLRFAVTVWLIMVTVRVYFTGVTLVRSRLLSPNAAARRVAWIPLSVIATAVAIVGGSAVGTFSANPPAGFTDLITRLETIFATGATGVVLWPFTAMTRPLFAPLGVPFLTALVWPLGILAVTFAWVMYSDGALQDAMAHVVERRTDEPRTQTRVAARARATGLSLAPTGRLEAAFCWKNATQMMRSGGRTIIRYIAPLIAVGATGATLAFSATNSRGGAAAACVFAGGLAAFFAILGPQMVRTDLRSDLQHLELLKTWPVKPAVVVRGEMLWPIMLLSGVVALAIACAAIFSAAAFPQVALATRLSTAVAALIVAPALLAAQYLVHNAAAVFFPAWIPQGDQRPRGLDAMGQRLIMLGGVMLCVIVLMLPGAIAAGAIWFAFQRLVGTLVFIPAAVVCSALVAVEVLAFSELLGRFYEELDVLSVERSE
jgi:hypothetical protein